MAPTQAVRPFCLGGGNVSNFRRMVALGFSLTITACSISPSAEDVTGLPTHLIAHRVRCEARIAIRDNLTQWLDDQGNPKKNGDPRYLAISKIVKTGPPDQVKAALYNGPAKAIVEKLADTAIAYDFTFNGTEKNNFDPIVDVTGIFHRGAASANVSGMFDRSRQNIESFLITDTFIDLLLDPPRLPCDKDEIIYEKNFAYPITGNVGIGRFINEFVNLSLFDNLGNEKDPKTPKTQTYSAVLTFTTTKSLSATPKLVLTPVGMGFHLIDASLGLTDSRTDIHALTIGFALTPPAPPAPPPVAGKKHPSASSAPAAPVAALAPVLYSGLFVNSTPGTPAEALCGAGN
jgi:hypothetical protein